MTSRNDNASTTPTKPAPTVDPASLDEGERAAIAAYQASVATEAAAYRLMAGRVADDANRATLERIADEKDADAAVWTPYTGAEPSPAMGRARRYARPACSASPSP